MVVKGVSGCVSMTSTLVLRFNYGQAIPWVTRTENGICAVVGPDTVWLHAETKLEGEHLETVSKFEVNEGQEVTFELVYGTYDSYGGKATPKPVDVEQTYRQTRDFWTSWASRCNYRGEYREPVMRSLVTLKSLIFRPTGGWWQRLRHRYRKTWAAAATGITGTAGFATQHLLYWC